MLSANGVFAYKSVKRSLLKTRGSWEQKSSEIALNDCVHDTPVFLAESKC